MSPSLAIQLCEKYPKIFKNRYASPKESAFAFGFECSDGWYRIIDILCESATYTYSTSIHIDDDDAKHLNLRENSCDNEYFFEVNPPQFVADQVKEKFGTLRFYYHLVFDEQLVKLSMRTAVDGTEKYPRIQEIMRGYENYFDGIVHMAETMSAHTCEITGREGELHVSGGNMGGWYKTLNRVYAKEDEFYAGKNYVPVKDLPEPL
jgi:hypothetical protein